MNLRVLPQACAMKCEWWLGAVPSQYLLYDSVGCRASNRLVDLSCFFCKSVSGTGTYAEGFVQVAWPLPYAAGVVAFHAVYASFELARYRNFQKFGEVHLWPLRVPKPSSILVLRSSIIWWGHGVKAIIQTVREHLVRGTAALSSHNSKHMNKA